MSELDTVRRILALMKATFGEPGQENSTFQTYYDGDPERIPVFNLPALVVTQTGDSTDQGAFATDDVTDKLTIKVIFNKADDYTGDKVDPLNMTERKIREIVGRIDPDTKTYAVKTIKSVLRNVLLDGVTVIAPTFGVEYGINPRSGGADYASLTAEGHVNFTVQYSINTQ